MKQYKKKFKHCHKWDTEKIEVVKRLNLTEYELETLERLVWFGNEDESQDKITSYWFALTRGKKNLIVYKMDSLKIIDKYISMDENAYLIKDKSDVNELIVIIKLGALK